MGRLPPVYDSIKVLQTRYTGLQKVTLTRIMESIHISDPVAVDLQDVSNLGHVHKLVDQPLAVHFRQDSSLVVIPGVEQVNTLPIAYRL